MTIMRIPCQKSDISMTLLKLHFIFRPDDATESSVHRSASRRHGCHGVSYRPRRLFPSLFRPIKGTSKLQASHWTRKVCGPYHDVTMSLSLSSSGRHEQQLPSGRKHGRYSSPADAGLRHSVWYNDWPWNSGCGRRLTDRQHHGDRDRHRCQRRTADL